MNEAVQYDECANDESTQVTSPLFGQALLGHLLLLGLKQGSCSSPVAEWRISFSHAGIAVTTY
jgi:hypothetical protein